MNKSDKIFVAGHRGMVGSAIVRWLESDGFNNPLTRDHSQLDLANESAVAKFFAGKRPTIVIVAAAKVGGITMPTNFCGSNDNSILRHQLLGIG
jgi:GDP-L-fucose synthase